MKIYVISILIFFIFIIILFKCDNSKSNYKFNLYPYEKLYNDGHLQLNNTSPKFKLKAFCISLLNRPKNLEFIKNEWNEFLDIHHFYALKSCTKSHTKILCDIWINKDIESFPIVVMEDDVYRLPDFSKYWNAMFEIDNKDLDYIAFDGTYLKFKSSQHNVDPNFVSLLQHRGTGFTVFYKNFFDKFNSRVQLLKYLKKGLIDMNYTHDPKFVNWMPKRQVCRQIVDKKSTTAHRITTSFESMYDNAAKLLRNNFPN